MRSFRLPLLNPAGSRDGGVLALAPNVFDPSQLQNLALCLRADRDVQSDTCLQLVAASSQYLSLSFGDSANYNMGSDHFTVAFWVYQDSSPAAQYIVTKHQSSNGSRGFYVALQGSGNIDFRISDDGTNETQALLTGSGIMDLNWFFIVARYDGVNISLRHYSTSALLGNQATAHTTGMFSNTKNFLIGSRSNPPSSTVDGRIDSVGVWKGRALTDTECDTLWNTGLGKTYADLTTAEKVSLLSWHDMNEASGTRMDSHTGGYHASEKPGTVLSSVGIRAGTADDEDSVSLWNDQSDVGNDAAQGSAAARPTFQDNIAPNKPGLTFDGSDDIFEISSISLGSDLLIAWVEGYTSGVSLVLSDSADADFFIRHDSATSLTVGEPIGVTSQVTHANIGSANHISMLVRESGVMTYYLDGTSHDLGTFTADWFFNRIGGLQGNLSELIVIADRNPPDSERNQLGRYLARKYSLTWSPSS